MPIYVSERFFRLPWSDPPQSGQQVDKNQTSTFMIAATVGGPTSLLGAVAAGVGLAFLFACGDSIKRRSIDTEGGDSVADPGLSGGTGENKVPSSDAGLPAEIVETADGGETSPPTPTYDHSDMLPPGEQTRCLDDHTIVVENMETGERLYTGVCPEGMECSYDICMNVVGEDFPPWEDWPVDLFPEDNAPLHCHAPRVLDGNTDDENFWNEFDPEGIKRERVRCAIVAENEVAEDNGTLTVDAWSAVSADQVPEDFTRDTMEHTSYSDIRNSVCDETDSGLFLSSHDPVSWARASFDGLPFYREDARNSDFYLADLKTFSGGANPATSLKVTGLDERIGGFQAGGSTNVSMPTSACEYFAIPVMYGSYFDSTGALDLYLQPLDGEGIGLTAVRVWNCLCPLAISGSQ